MNASPRPRIDPELERRAIESAHGGGFMSDADADAALALAAESTAAAVRQARWPAPAMLWPYAPRGLPPAATAVDSNPVRNRGLDGRPLIRPGDLLAMDEILALDHQACLLADPPPRRGEVDWLDVRDIETRPMPRRRRRRPPAESAIELLLVAIGISFLIGLTVGVGLYFARAADAAASPLAAALIREAGR